MAFSLLVLGATLHAANAQNYGRSLPQCPFMKDSQNSGGTVGAGFEDSVGSAWRTWRNPDGTVTEVTCEFTGPYLWFCTGQTRISSS